MWLQKARRYSCRDGGDDGAGVWCGGGNGDRVLIRFRSAEVAVMMEVTAVVCVTHRVCHSPPSPAIECGTKRDPIALSGDLCLQTDEITNTCNKHPHCILLMYF